MDPLQWMADRLTDRVCEAECALNSSDILACVCVGEGSSKSRNAASHATALLNPTSPPRNFPLAQDGEIPGAQLSQLPEARGISLSSVQATHELMWLAWNGLVFCLGPNDVPATILKFFCHGCVCR